MNTSRKLFIPRPDMRLGERYQLVECLGEGSYGWVWRSERIEDGKTIALKIPKAQASKKSDLEEGKWLIDKPSHPNVIQIFWMGRVRQSPVRGSDRTPWGSQTIESQSGSGQSQRCQGWRSAKATEGIAPPRASR